MPSKLIKQIPRKFPEKFEPGSIKTFNGKGFMFTDISPAGEEFVKLAKTTTKPLVDIGAAFGVCTYPALEAGADVIAIDICQEHLDILQSNIPDCYKEHLKIMCGSFPEDFDFEDNSISGILVSMVLPFLKPETLILALNKCYNWLEKNGCLFIYSITPHLPFYDMFYSTYKENVRNNVKWPGILDPTDCSSGKYEGALPDFLNLLDKKTLIRECKSAGFKIVKTVYNFPPSIPRHHYRNGKEFINIIAQK